MFSLSKRQYFTSCDVARLARIGKTAVRSHARMGAIPSPKIVLEGGKRRYYTAVEALAIVTYFAGREKHDKIQKETE